jgi:hypothetical protein
MPSLKDHVCSLALLRRSLDDAKTAEAEQDLLLRETAEYQALTTAKQARQDIERAVSLAASTVRESALAEFRQTGDKSPAKGVSIRLFRVYKYDPTEAINWCMLNAPTFLAVDAKRFEKAAEQLPGAPVTIEYDPQPAIASDLSEYLG